jgi:tetratricopeptide (TPR) repeat protein
MFLLIIAAVAAAGAAAWWYFHPRPTVVEVKPVDDQPDEITVVNPGYLGPQACAECHAERVAEFFKTRHAIACIEPSRDNVTAAFEARAPLTARNSGVRFEMSRAGDEFLLTAVRPSSKGQEQTSARIGLVYGSRGAGDEMYFTWHGDHLYELPMAWLYPQGCWGNTTIDPHGSGDFGRETGPRCLECHNTWIGHVPGSHNEYRRDGRVLGVTCERCHGPGADHVAFHKDHPEAKRAESIVQPKSLERERQMEVCTQCHSNAIKPRDRAFSYRPGTPLADSYATIVTKNPEDDHVANQVQYLRKSKCFLQSDMTCVTCHNPHKPTDLTAVQRSCLKCHEPASCKDREHQPAAVRNDCTACHMPPRVWMNVHFHTKDDQYVPPIRRHEHRIAVHPEARNTVLFDWCAKQSDAESKKEAERQRTWIVDYWLAESERRRSDHRLLASIGALREALRVNPTATIREKLDETERDLARLNALMSEGVYLSGQRRFPEGIARFEEAIALQPELALAHIQLGTALLQAGKSGPAAHEFRLAAKYDENDPNPHFMLAKMALDQKKPQEALQSARRAEEVGPFSDEISYVIGVALLDLNRDAEAADAFRKAIRVNPRNAGALQRMAHVLRKRGKAAEGVEFALKAVKLTHYENADMLLTLADTYADAGRLSEAEDVAEKAIAAAQKHDAGLAPIARRRLEQIKSRGR